ncbi:hypothetical protein [Prosthecobacter sp.]|uniref:hypothetical protein n=1 Tax=Prosthecobacter sp. TaxID=1965333 RepID=UPI0037835020
MQHPTFYAEGSPNQCITHGQTAGFNATSLMHPPSTSMAENSKRWLAAPVLEMACMSFGGSDAWVVRNSGECVELLMSAKGRAPGEWELGLMKSSHERGLGDRQFMIYSNCGRNLLCADLMPVAESDGSLFTFAILFEGFIKITERSSGMLDAFRCSIQVMMSCQMEKRSLDRHLQKEDVNAVCAGCRRLKTRTHGWLHWDDHFFITQGRAPSHIICESCAAKIDGPSLN